MSGDHGGRKAEECTQPDGARDEARLACHILRHSQPVASYSIALAKSGVVVLKCRGCDCWYIVLSAIVENAGAGNLRRVTLASATAGRGVHGLSRCPQ